MLSSEQSKYLNTFDYSEPNKLNHMSVSHKIKSQRENLKLSQDDLAKLSSVSLRTIQRIESGETEPQGNTIRKVYKVLNLDIDTPNDKFYDRSLLVINLSCLSYIIFPPLGSIVPLCTWFLSQNVKSNRQVKMQIILFQIIWLALLIGGYLFFRWYALYLFKQNQNISLSISMSVEWKLIIFVAICYVINFTLVVINSVRISSGKYPRYIPFWTTT